MKQIIKSVFALSLLSMVSACRVAPKPAMPVSHDLGSIIPLKNSMAVTLTAPVWLWNEKIRYRLLYKDATAVAYYNLDRWAAPLPALLKHRLMVTANTTAQELHIHLTQFEQQFSAINNAHVLMTFTVSAFAGDSKLLLAKRSFTLSYKTTTADAEGAIAGFVVLTEQANKVISVWLESLLDTRNSGN
ncbi:MAG: cholesterol transport system auxiliary component [Methyloprofundus sp.]|nr:MAG: cholesterol transport system auxiliary component [Methyloprofundus sp.]